MLFYLEPTSGQIIKLLLKCLRYDNQVSVRYLMEWMTALIFCHHPDLLEPLFYPCLQQVLVHIAQDVV